LLKIIKQEAVSKMQDRNGDLLANL